MTHRREQTLWRIDAAAIAIAVAFTAVALLVGLKPIVEQRFDRADQQQRLAEYREQADTLDAMLRRTRAQLGRAEEAIELSELRLEPVRHLNRRVADLAELAGHCDLNLHEIQPGSAVSGQRYEIVPIHLAGIAAYADCARFLRELAEQFPDVTLAAMDLRAAPAAEGRAAEFRFTLTWHAAPNLAASAEPGADR